MVREWRGSPMLSSAVSRTRVAARGKRMQANRSEGAPARGREMARGNRGKKARPRPWIGQNRADPSLSLPLSATYNIKLTRRLFTRCRGADRTWPCYRQVHAAARSRNELFRQRRRDEREKTEGVGGNIGTVLSRRRKILSVTRPPLTEAAGRGSKRQRYYAD